MVLFISVLTYIFEDTVYICFINFIGKSKIYRGEAVVNSKIFAASTRRNKLYVPKISKIQT